MVDTTNFVQALGGGSGIDTTALVNSLVEAERAPQQARIDSTKQTLETQISAYGQLRSSLATFQNSLTPLTDPDLFSARSASIPSTDVITANSLAASAQPGNYQIEITQTAQAQSLATSLTNSSRTAALGLSGNVTFAFGTQTYDGSNNPLTFTESGNTPSFTLAIEATDTLDTIAEKINSQNSGAQATVLQVNGNFQLVLSSSSGEQNSLNITVDDPSLSGIEFNTTNAANVTQTQQGRDAQLLVNGISITRPTNEIDDIIQGFSFSINRADPGNQINFSILEDTSTAETAIRDFVTAYNEIFNNLSQLTSRDVTTNEDGTSSAGDLAGDGTARNILNLIRQTISQEVVGTDGLTALTNVGIRTQLDGTLEIVEEDFRRAIDTQFDQVGELFAPSISTDNPAVQATIGSAASDAVPGTYAGTITTAPTRGNTVGSNLTFASFDTSTFPAGSFDFAVNVDGTDSGTLSISGNFTTQDELRLAIQTAINNDSALSAANLAVDVTINANGGFDVTSQAFGAASNVTFTSADADFTTQTGLSTSSTSTAGIDVAGTIQGAEAFGSGNILLPPLNSNTFGLNFTVQEGATGNFNLTYSQGFAGSLSNLIDDVLSNNGLIGNRETTINRELASAETDQENLDRRIALYRERLTQQYIASERILASLNSTNQQLTGLIDRLPFTAPRQ